VEVVREKRPGVTEALRSDQNISQSPQELVAVGIVAEDASALNPSADNMPKGTGGVYSRPTWHSAKVIMARHG
jgi:hypothetical protein